MRYLGGKSKIARKLAPPILAELRQGQAIWEPFCGGLGMTAALAQSGAEMLVSDACRPLISLYQHYARGWRPRPGPVTPVERDAALGLTDHDPWKAFVRFGCGFGGDWAGGTTANGLDWNGDALADQAARSLARTFTALDARVSFVCLDFLDLTPIDGQPLIYCDPPYRGTATYMAVPPFDHDLFESRVAGWADAGATVFVSEFEFPIGDVVLELDRARHVPGRGTAREKLFRVGP